MVSGTDQGDVTTGNACWQTPPSVAAALCAEFGCDIDLFANARSKVLPTWLGPGSPIGEDALAVDWHRHGTAGFSNPPYGDFLKLVLAKAAYEAWANAFTSVHLLPLRLNAALRTAIFGSEQVSHWLFPDKRIAFWENGAPRMGRDKRSGVMRPMPALFDSTILVFGPGTHVTPKIGEWKVPTTTKRRRRQAA